MGLDTLANGIVSTIKSNPAKSALVAGGVGLVGVGTAVAVSRRKRKKSSKRKRSRKTSSSRRSRRARRRKTPRTAGKGKDRSTKRIRYTKNGQPYIILRNGRARFIKASSARRSHKRKGGRY